MENFNFEWIICHRLIEWGVATLTTDWTNKSKSIKLLCRVTIRDTAVAIQANNHKLIQKRKDSSIKLTKTGAERSTLKSFKARSSMEKGRTSRTRRAAWWFPCLIKTDLERLMFMSSRNCSTTSINGWTALKLTIAISRELLKKLSWRKHLHKWDSDSVRSLFNSWSALITQRRRKSLLINSSFCAWKFNDSPMLSVSETHNSKAWSPSALKISWESLWTVPTKMICTTNLKFLIYSTLVFGLFDAFSPKMLVKNFFYLK